MPQCKGRRNDGEPCGVTNPGLIDDDGYCPAHREGGAEHMKSVSAAGGQANKARYEFPSSELPNPISTHEDAKRWLDAITRGIAGGSLDRRDGSVMVRAVGEWVKVHTSQMQVEDLYKLQKQVADLTRLIFDNRKLFSSLPASIDERRA